MDLLYVAGPEIQIFHEKSKIVDLSLGHTVQRCKFFTKDPELWTLLCTAGSEVQVSLLNFKVANFDCIKGNIPRISSDTWLFAKNTGWFVVLRSNP